MMKRRQFLKAGLAAGSLFSILPLTACEPWRSQNIVPGLGGALSDNDEDDGSDLPAGVAGEGSLNLKFWSFEAVSSRLSPYLESQFDMFFFCNTAAGGKEGELFPFQHIKVVRRNQPGTNLFVRDEKGVITGLTEDAEVWAVIPTTTGIGSPYIKTPSGIFRFHHSESRSRIGSNEHPELPMSHSMYIDFVYRTGRESRVAIHGTPTRNHKLLGVSRGSHGCMRVLPKTAKVIRDLLLSPEMWSETLPEFDRRQELPSLDLMEGRVRLRPGVRALAVIFEGF